MNHIPCLWKRLTVWSSLAVLAASLLICSPCPAPAAPDQERLNRPPSSLREPRHHDFKAERDRRYTEGTGSKQHSSAKNTQNAIHSTFSDRAFLSASLAREESIMTLAKEVLRTHTHGGRQVAEWAKQVLDSAEKNSLFLEKTLHGEGGIDRHAYTAARKALSLHSGDSAKYSAPARFVMLLFPYCEQTMTASISALLESPQENVSDLAAEMLIERAKLSLEVRHWLHTHHYKNNV